MLIRLLFGSLAGLEIVLQLISLLLASVVVSQTSLDELQGALVLADLEQLNHSLLIRLQAGHLTNEVANKLSMLVLLIEHIIRRLVLIKLTIERVKIRIPMAIDLVELGTASQPSVWLSCGHGSNRRRVGSPLGVCGLVVPF